MLTVGEQDVWQCPRCGRGSPDIRDEAAHRDAHRRLERDRNVVTWEILVHRLARLEPESVERNRRGDRLLLSVLAALLFGSLLLSVRTGEFGPPPASEATAPTAVTPATAPTTPTTAPRSSTTDRPGPAAATPAPPVDIDTATPPSSPPAISPPLTAGPTPPTTTPAPPADRPHLLELCIPSLCLAV